MYWNRISLTAAMALSCLALGCGSKGPTDQELATEIQAKLYANDATKAANVNVAVKDGVVTLTGQVPTSDVELQAVKIANGAAGVRTVTDQMKLNDAMAANALPPIPAVSAPPSQPAPRSAAPVMAPPPVQPSPAPVVQAPPPPPPVEPERREPSEPVVRREPKPVTVTIPAGERLAVRMIDGINTKTNTEGQTFRASLDAPLTADGRVIVPVGAPVTVLLAAARGAGRIKGQSSVELRVTGLAYHGEEVRVSTAPYEESGKARGKQSAIRTGIGAAAGALIGGLAGGGKGAAIGSAAGGGAGIGLQAFTHGEQVKIPPETPLSFRLSAPLTFTVRR